MIRSSSWELDPGSWKAVCRELRFRHFKWDTWVAGSRNLLPERLEVDPPLHHRVVQVAEALDAALGRFEERALRNPELLDRLAIPGPLHPLVTREPDHGLSCARYDLFPTPDGRLMVSEFNEDVPGGFNETQGLPDILGDPGPGLCWPGGFRDAFLRAFRPYRRVALLYATAFSEDLQHMLILERWLREAGHQTVLASPEHLRTGWRGVRVLGLPVDAAFRFFPGEWIPALPNFREWLGVGPRLPMMNPIRRLVRQSKLLFAVWRDDPELDPEDRALVERHCPRTFPFTPDRAAAVASERERWVLKRAFGRMGDAVVMGNLAPAAAWGSAVAEATRNPREWCIQERFEVAPLQFESGSMYPALGAFLVNGAFAAYYSRVAPLPFLTHEAFHVATLVRTA